MEEQGIEPEDTHTLKHKRKSFLLRGKELAVSEKEEEDQLQEGSVTRNRREKEPQLHGRPREEETRACDPQRRALPRKDLDVA